MASAVLSRHGFVEGTSVGAWPAQNSVNGNAPAGPSVATAVVTAGVLTFTGLTVGARYIAYAAGRGVAFRADELLGEDAAPLPAGDRHRLKYAEEMAGAGAVGLVMAVVKEAPLHFKDPRVAGVMDGSDETAKMQTWLGMAPATGGHLVLDSGTVLSGEVTATSKNRLTITAEPGAIWKRKPVGSPDQGRVATITSCDDFRLQGVSVDVNNIERYGGMYFDSCDRPRILFNRFFDSNLNASWSSFDHYSLVFVATGIDTWVIGNEAEDVELVEWDNSEGFVCTYNVSRRCAGTAPIGWYSVSSGSILKAALIAYNHIIDPRRFGIVVQHESGGLNNNVIRALRIIGNIVEHLTSTAGDQPLIQVGNFTGSASSGNSYQGIAIEHNQLYVDAALTARTKPHLFVMQQPGNVFDDTSILFNRIRGKLSGGEWAADIRRLGGSSRVQGQDIAGAVTHAMSLDNLAGTFIADNTAAGSTSSFALTNSQGKNVVPKTNVDRQPATPVFWVPTGVASDLIVA